MHTPVPWHAIARPLDVFAITVPQTFLRRWVAYDRTPTGMILHARTLDEQPVPFRVDVIQPDVLRVRMIPPGVTESARPSEMLIQDDWPPVPFTLEETPGCLILTTERLRAELQRFPWQMRVHDLEDPALPFFSQRIDDRAYGPAYEVAPIGFDAWGEDHVAVRETIAVTPGEAFYGFGEKFTALDKWGQEIVSWAVDAGNVSSHRAYKNVPFFLSTAGYGVFVHSSYPIVYRLGTESSLTYSFHVAQGPLDYFLLRGPSFKHILARYGELTGYAPVPPKWSFGFWLSRAGYKRQDEVERTVRELRARDFPCDVLSLDPWWMGDPPWSTLAWDAAQFPDPAGMMRTLREQGVRTCLWITPYAPEGSALFAEARARGYLIRDAQGQIAPVMEAFAGGLLGAVDFTNPDAEAWYLDKLAVLLEQGAAVFKTDFGEQAPVEAVYHDGRSGLELHNLYPLLYNRAVFGLTQRTFGRGLTWGRSAYAGSQRYPVQWGGDSYASLDQLAGQIRGLLGYGLSGVPFCSHDVGGFDYPPAAFDQGQDLNVGEHVSSVSTALLESFPRDAVVYARWMQFGAFSSHMRAHGKAPHEPWMYGPEVEAIARRYLKLRYRLLPYLYTAAVQSAQTGVPVVRPLVLEFQDDPATRRLDQQYLFGDSFLVAPVTNAAGRVTVYLPHGEWIDYWTKQPIAGGRWLDLTVPLETLPLWVRTGAIIPMGPELAYVDEKPLDPLTLEFYTPRGAGSLAIADEDRPDIVVRYEREATRLDIDVSGAPGAVEIVLYGVIARSASCAGRAVPIETLPLGQRLRCADGRLTLELSE